jgi:signal peptidase I
MADTLMGAHFRLRCPQCGYRYNYGFVPEIYGLRQDTLPRGNLRPVDSRCPSCGYYQQTGRDVQIANGDRILVLKCIYQFFEPKQWDVIVFKNPLDPQINFIKRLIGRPGETVEIIDGDIYINGQISRKPPKVQNELWMPVYNNDYQPIRPGEPAFNGHKWRQPFKNTNGSKWTITKNSPARFNLDSPVDQINTLVYDTSVGNNFRAAYAYDAVDDYDYLPFCSDLMARFYAGSSQQQGCIGIELSKYQTIYKASVDFTGIMTISKIVDGNEIILARRSVTPIAAGVPSLVQFANVDHLLLFQFDSEKLTFDLGRSSDDTGPRAAEIEPQVKIFGAGTLTLSHVALFRDIHYTNKQFAGSRSYGKAVEGSPFKLQKDEFFVLGDNSPNSADGRWWNMPGKGNNGKLYPEGIVPREYLVGKALFVYWPSGFRLFMNDRLAVIPNIGRMRFIYSGSDRTLQ